MSPSLGIKLGANLHEQAGLFRRSRPGTRRQPFTPPLAFSHRLKAIKTCGSPRLGGADKEPALKTRRHGGKSYLTSV